ncbi:MAG: helix-turn-helix domain-containing protein [Rhodospirillales bacterium]|nr:helix-turn-helix domain-containing protein [Rhodospirillales bacterium]
MSDAESNVVQLRSSARAINKSSEQKWGKAVTGCGFAIVPSILIRGQQRLGLSPMQINVLVHLLDYWWSPETHPYPSKRSIATRMGVSPRTIQKAIADLEVAGLVKRIARRTSAGDPNTNMYDLSGLVETLIKLEPEFRRAKEVKEEVQRTVETPKGRRRRS